MKALLFSLLLLPVVASATPYVLEDYRMSLPDLAESTVTKESLYSSMDRDFVKVGSSICSNRALMWTYDMKKKHDVDAGKIFLFYTNKTGKVGRKTWWYHVSPVVNESGKLWVLDAGFPGHIDGPLSVDNWIEKFIGVRNCKEIRAGEDELIDYMFRGHVFPETTRYGRHDCYYKITPAGYWTPASVAMNLLGKDGEGRPVHFVRDEINPDEVYSACLEATTSTLGGLFRLNKKKCQKFLR